MASIDVALAWTFRREGGKTNEASDPGGATNLGVTLAVLREVGPDADLDRDGDVDVDDLYLLTHDKARDLVYRPGYWQYDAVRHQPIATKAFDAGVNLGASWGAKALQRAAAAVTGRPLAFDGKIGPASIEAINSAAFPGPILMALVDLQTTEYWQRAEARVASSWTRWPGWVMQDRDRALRALRERDLATVRTIRADLERRGIEKRGPMEYMQGWLNRARLLPPMA